MERLLEGNYGMPKGTKAGGVGANEGAGEGAKAAAGSGGIGDSRPDAARVLSTFGGAAFAADGVGREIAGLFTATSDGIFF